MTPLNTNLESDEAVVAYSNPGAVPLGAQEPTEGRLGAPPLVPALALAVARPQCRGMTRTHLRLEERLELEIGLRAGDTQAALALRLNRSPGTISRELALNGGRTAYRAVPADRAARGRQGTARRGFCAIAQHPPLAAAVQALLHRGWSPEETAGWLRRQHPADSAMHTSHESIYTYIHVVARGELKRTLVADLRRHHAQRRPRRRGPAATQGQLKDMVLIDHRPAEVQTRATPGHFEGDLIMGPGNASAVGVIVERQTRFTILCHLPKKDATSVREAFERKLSALPAQLRLSLTYDQGKEMAEHAQLAANLKLKVFFCHGHSPWERATCESQNGRIRHYLPKGLDLSTVSPQKLRAFQDMLNERPRKVLNHDSPAERFHKLLISSESSN